MIISLCIPPDNDGADQWNIIEHYWVRIEERNTNLQFFWNIFLGKDGCHIDFNAQQFFTVSFM